MNKLLVEQILSNKYNAAILDRLHRLKLNDAWLVAGCLFQTAWNAIQKSPPESKIKDYDIFYFDPVDLSQSGEGVHQEKADELFEDLGVNIEVKNQARVHLWYRDYFGFDYPKLESVKDGIDKFLILETCIGIKSKVDGLCLYAPHGIEGIYAGTLTPNPLTNHRTLFEQKANSYKMRWPWLQVND